MIAIESIQLNTTSLHERELTVTVPSKLVEQEFTHALNNIQRVARRKGFRPGKMPKNMVINFFGAEIKEKLIKKLIEKSFDFACEKENVTPVSEPKWAPLGDVEQDKPFTYRAIFQVKPKVSEVEYKGLDIELKKICYDETDVDDELADLQASMATFVEPPDRQEITENDLVECDSVVKVDGIISPEYSHKDYSLPMFAENVPADIKASLMGKKISEHATVNYTMPTDHQDVALAGKQCEMHLTIRSFKERVLPKIDDEFAKDISDKFESLLDLKESIRLRFKITARHREDYYRQEAITKALVDKNPMEVPDALVSRMALALINRELEAIGKKAADELVKDHWHELWQSVQGRALFRVKAELLMEALIKELGINATEEEILAKANRVKEITKEDAAYSVKAEKLLIVIEKEANLSSVEEPLFKAGN